MIRSAAGFATRAARSMVHVVRHPLATTSYAAGVARGLAAEGIRLASGGSQRYDAPPGIPDDVPVRSADSIPDPERVPLRPGERHAAEMAEAEAAEASSPVAAEAGEPFATEPHAVSRESAHGDGPIDDADVDRWQEDAEAALAGEGVPDAPVEDDEPLLDPSVAKQVRSEAETMQRGARTD